MSSIDVEGEGEDEHGGNEEEAGAEGACGGEGGGEGGGDDLFAATLYGV